MPLQNFKIFLLPVLAIVFINIVAGLWRTLPDAVSASSAAEAWPEFELPIGALDVKNQLLGGGHWGKPESLIGTEEQNTDQASALKEESVVREYVQQQLQGIVNRNGWYLLLAQEGETLPLELQEGDSLPGSPWTVGRISPDRIELLDDSSGSMPLIIFLYPIPDASTEL